MISIVVMPMRTESNALGFFRQNVAWPGVSTAAMDSSVEHVLLSSRTANHHCFLLYSHLHSGRCC